MGIRVSACRGAFRQLRVGPWSFWEAATDRTPAARLLGPPEKPAALLFGSCSREKRELRAGRGSEVGREAEGGGRTVNVFETIRWSQARCATGDATLVSLFFSEDPAEVAQAKALCHTCPLREPCLEGAISRREPVGVWGGELFDRGRVIERKRPRGRPRKSELVPAAAEAVA